MNDYLFEHYQLRAQEFMEAAAGSTKRKEVALKLAIRGCVDTTHLSERDGILTGLVSSGVAPVFNYNNRKISQVIELVAMSTLQDYFLHENRENRDLFLKGLIDLCSTGSTRDALEENKSFALHSLLAYILIRVANEINGRPITNHPLFERLQDTYLSKYTLVAQQYFVEPEVSKDKFAREDAGMFLSMVRAMGQQLFTNRMDSKMALPKWLIFPPQVARVDIFGALVAIDPMTTSLTVPLCCSVTRSSKLDKIKQDAASLSLANSPFRTIDGSDSSDAQQQQARKHLDISLQKLPKGKEVHIIFAPTFHGSTSPTSTDFIEILWTMQEGNVFAKYIETCEPFIYEVLNRSCLENNK